MSEMATGSRIEDQERGAEGIIDSGHSRFDIRRSADTHLVSSEQENKKPRLLSKQRLSLQLGGESGIRTPDLRIMIPSL